jgi:pyrimidine-nucleoside phosphorylase
MAARKRRTTKKVKPSFAMPELIATKRDGGALSDEEIRWLVAGYTSAAIPDYQMSALAMAIYFSGMKPEETTALTLAMRDSGKVVDTSKIRGKKIDKHSTGGVGDKVSICLAPIVAACGVKVPMVSGRGLGHTGGTLDKLEAIPGFRVDMTTRKFVSLVGKNGCALIGQTADIAPADKRLYALRDVTGTVESIPLITASILSKKLAEGIDGLVLDVKVGTGAFMKTKKEARALARSIVRVGALAKKRVTAILTAMDQPLGCAVGNALETAEALEVLAGEGPEDLVEITMTLGAEMIRMAGLAKTEAAARKKMRAAIEDGSAADVMERIVKSQDGDPRVVREPDRLPSAPKKKLVRAKKSGWVRGIDAREVGLACMALGAGRTRADQEIDPAVGAILEAKVGSKVAAGGTLATLHVRNDAQARAAVDRVRKAYDISTRRVSEPKLVIETIRA